MSAEVAQPPNGESALLSRLQSYTLVSSAVGLYQNLKSSSNLASRGLELCETVAKRGIEVSIPVIKKVDEYTHIDERSVLLLDALETKAVQAKDGLVAVNDFAHHPLDSMIDALDTYLPLPEHRGDSDSADAVTAVSLKDKEELTSVGKLGAIGAHLGQAGVVKLRELQLRGPVHKLVASQMWELVSYSAATLHLENMGDRAAAQIADAQHVLFAQAANAATNIQAFVEQRPMLLAVEKTLEPYALTTKSYVEATVIRVIAAVHAGSELTSHFFANRVADVNDVSLRATHYAIDLIKQLRAQHPDAEQRIAALLTSVRATFTRASNLIQKIASVPVEQFHTAFASIYQVISQLQTTVAAFRSQLLVSAKKEEAMRLDIYPSDLPSPSAPDTEKEYHESVQQPQQQPPTGHGKQNKKRRQ